MDSEEGSVENESKAHEQKHEAASADAITLKMLTLPSMRCPFEDWYKAFKDAPTRQRIRARLNRLATGNFGDFKPVGGEVYEIRLDFGPGYRIYFARLGETFVVLLVGGDKSTQQKDIDRAIEMWKEHKNDAERFQSDF